MIMIKLTENERENLKKLHKNYRNDQSKSDRIKAILLLDKGLTSKQVAEYLLIDEDTVTAIKKRFIHKLNIENWLDDRIIKYEGELSQSQLLTVKIFVKNSIIKDSKQVQEFILTKFGVKYASSNVIALLHRLGFVFKISKIIPGKLDKEKQLEFKEKYEAMEKNISEDEVFVFVDGAHPQHNTETTRLWILKGTEKEIKSNTGRNRINLNGAYNPHNGDVIIREDVSINSQSTIELFKQIEEAYTDKQTIYVIADNAKYYKSTLVKEYLENSRIEILFLPPYSPNLNLIERLWKFLRKKIINTQYYSDFKEFKKAVMEFFKNINNYKEELKTFIGFKMHLV